LALQTGHSAAEDFQELTAARLGSRGTPTSMVRDRAGEHMASRHRARRAAAVLAIAGGVVSLGTGPAGAQQAAPPTTIPFGATTTTISVPTDAEVEAKRKAVEKARADADAAAKAYVEATSELGRIEQRITVLAERIPRLERRIAELKNLLAQRAAVLYRGGETAAGFTVLDELSSTGDLLAGGRIARLADAAQERTDAQMDELDQHRAQLEQDRKTMREARERQEMLVAEANKRAQDLDAALAVVAGELQVAEQQQALDRYLKALAAQRAAAEAAASEQKSQTSPADPALAARIPVLDLLCPIAGPVSFTDDWGQPRSSWRVHQGTDVFASRGTPNVAVGDGIAKKSNNKLGGNALWVYTPDGNAFYYAHLDAYEGEWNAEGARVVKKGDVIGYTGNTGNAAGGPVHTHVQIHPGDIGPINPYPLLREMCAVEGGFRPPPPPPPAPDPNTTTTAPAPPPPPQP
jgi:murein DD-endopeptidase MepM/ murein hydrolase activator NlpD